METRISFVSKKGSKLTDFIMESLLQFVSGDKHSNMSITIWSGSMGSFLRDTRLSIDRKVKNPSTSPQTCNFTNTKKVQAYWFLYMLDSHNMKKKVIPCHKDKFQKTVGFCNCPISKKRAWWKLTTICKWLKALIIHTKYNIWCHLCIKAIEHHLPCHASSFKTTAQSNPNQRSSLLSSC